VSVTDALSGLRVIDVGRFVTGPEAGVLLADLGADVIKVEEPRHGDPFRHYGEGGYAPPFRSLNRNKRSLAVDIASDEGKQVLLELIATADVVIENFRVGQTASWGWGYEELKTRFPRLIYCSISGFGATGPYRDRPGYDTVGVAVSGLLSAFIDLEDPEPLNVSLADHLAGIYAAYGILAALQARERTGRGQLVETSLLQSSVAFLAEYASTYFDRGVVPKRGDRARGAVAWAFVAGDGKPFVIHLSSPVKFWRGLATVVGHPEWLTDARFATAKDRRANYDTLVAALRAEFALKPRAEWLDQLVAADVPCAAINSLDEVFEDPQVKALGLERTITHPVMGDVRLVAPAVNLSDTPATWSMAPPVLGEHSEQVLTELGFDAERISALALAGTVRLASSTGPPQEE
jgi:crotonobetainyl-CoA:carnitine CoA-transferase CaiB-like acyl-CoA transferase